MRKPLVLFVATATSVGLAVFAPVAANAGAGDTPGTFTLTSSAGLSIAVPDGSVTPIDLGSASTGAASLSHALGNVTVTDGRGALPAQWTAAASTTNFTTGGASANETVTKANVGYW